HLAQSTPARFHFQSSAFHTYHTIAIAEGALRVEGGRMWASDAPGLGVVPDLDRLGPAVATIT
ncbi:MAG: mandelate racemase, partial [Pseudomonadota bacterium]